MNDQVKKILDIFSNINKVPRCSKNEEQIVKFLVNWATERNFKVKTDEIDNVLIIVPASKGYEDSPTIIIQGHMDMVCEKTPDSTHNFATDPIEHICYIYVALILDIYKYVGYVIPVLSLLSIC